MRSSGPGVDSGAAERPSRAPRSAPTLPFDLDFQLAVALDPGVVRFAGLTAALVAIALTLLARRPDLVVRYPVVVLAMIAAVTGVASAVLVRWEPPGLRLEIDPSTEPLLPRLDPARDAYAAAVRDFGDDEVYVLAMQTDDVFEADRLATLRRVHDAVAQMPEVRRVTSLADVVAFRWVPEEDWLEVGRFVDEIPEDPEALAALRDEALGHPLYRRSLVSDDGRTAAINVTFRKMSDREFIAAGIDQRIGEILEAEIRAGEGGGLSFHVAGRPHLKARVYHSMLRDLRLLIPASLAVVAACLFLVFGTRRGVVLPIAVVLLATLWTFGAMAWLERPLSVLTTLLAPTLIAVGSVYGIHALSRYEEEAKSAGTPREAVLRSLEHLRTPVLIAGLTTIVGFGALMWTDVPAVFELGAFAALGVACITLLTLSGLHAALALLPLRPAGERGLSGPIGERLESALGALGDAVARHSTLWLVGFALAVGASAWFVPRIVIDTDYLSFFDEGSEVRRDFEAVNRLLAGAVPIYVTLDGGRPARFRQPDALNAIERIQAGAEAIDGVSRTHALTDTVRVMNRAMSRDDPRQERIPDTGPEVAELIFMAPKGDLDRYTNADHSRANVMVRTGAVGTAAVRTLTDALAEVVSASGLPEGIEAVVTGNALLLTRSADGIARGQPRSVSLAVVAIFALIALGIGSFRLGLVAMVPNVVPVLMFYGLLGLGVAPLSLPTSLIGCVALGIAIDDTVHYLVRYRAERRRGCSAQEANAIAIRRVGRPVAITSFALMAGFAVVALSSFATLRQFGLLSAATMGLCLVTDLVLLPALLHRTRI
jgi:predicted RND superfamily exporter protein